MKKKIPKPPRLFYCNKCRVYFYSFSDLDHPSHAKCKGLKDNRLATKEEIQSLKEANPQLQNPFWGV